MTGARNETAQRKPTKPKHRVTVVHGRSWPWDVLLNGVYVVSARSRISAEQTARTIRAGLRVVHP